MQRVRIGLTGLSIVFLVVLLSAAMLGFASNETRIVTDAGGNVVTQNTTDAVADEGGPKEPLAELGVTPGNAPEGATMNMATPSRR